MEVARYNYAAQFHQLDDILKDIRRMLLEGNYILGEELREFETAFSSYLGARHTCGVNSGTDALIIAMLALDIGPGDEVITQANTFNATVAAISLVGAIPVLVDAKEESFCIDTSRLNEAVSPRTRALIPVHLYGKPAPMKQVMAFARKNGLRVIEDAAQAHGARYNGQAVGTFGDVGCFSFHPSKNLAAAGDGGAIVTQDAKLDGKIRLRRELGQRSQNNHVVVGLNSKLDAIQARILSSKLKMLIRWNEQRRGIARRYRDGLLDLPIGFQSIDDEEEHVYHLFQIQTDARDRLLEYLRANGIDAVVRYPTPIHLQPAFSHLAWSQGQFPIAERLARELLCLPLRPDMTDSEVDWVVDHVRSFMGA